MATVKIARPSNTVVPCDTLYQQRVYDQAKQVFLHYFPRALEEGPFSFWLIVYYNDITTFNLLDEITKQKMASYGLHAAILTGNTFFARKFISMGAKIGESHYAAAFDGGRLNTILEIGSYLSPDMRSADYCLDMSIKYGRFNLMQIFVERCVTEVKPEAIMKALITATKYGRREIFEYLLERFWPTIVKEDIKEAPADHPEDPSRDFRTGEMQVRRLLLEKVNKRLTTASKSNGVIENAVEPNLRGDPVAKITARPAPAEEIKKKVVFILKSPDFSNLLCLASGHGDVSFVMRIIDLAEKQGCKLDWQAALNCAASLDVALIFVSKGAADYRKALYNACLHGRTDIIDYLLYNALLEQEDINYVFLQICAISPDLSWGRALIDKMIVAGASALVEGTKVALANRNVELARVIGEYIKAGFCGPKMRTDFETRKGRKKSKIGSGSDSSREVFLGVWT